jgi:hypothetical protein
LADLLCRRFGAACHDLQTEQCASRSLMLRPRSCCPSDGTGARFESYSAAMTELTGKRFDNRGTYRLQAAHLRGVGRLAFGLGRYFDGLDVGEAAAHEFAAVRLGLLADDEQRIRHAIGDPCDPARRPTNVAISTLTLRHDRTTRETTCLLHWRDPNKVGHAGRLYQALPTGVFQAAGEAEGTSATTSTCGGR